MEMRFKLMRNDWAGHGLAGISNGYVDGLSHAD